MIKTELLGINCVVKMGWIFVHARFQEFLHTENIYAKHFCEVILKSNLHILHQPVTKNISNDFL